MLVADQYIAEDVIISKNLTLAPGQAQPSIRTVTALASTTDVQVTVTGLTSRGGYSRVRGFLAPGGGNLTLTVTASQLRGTGTRAARLDRGLALGSKGYLSPSKGHSIPISVTACKANHHFRVTSKTRLFRIDFDHELTPIVSGTRVVHRVSFGGLMKPVLALMLVPRIDEGLPETLRTLKTRAERDASRKA